MVLDHRCRKTLSFARWRTGYLASLSSWSSGVSTHTGDHLDVPKTGTLVPKLGTDLGAVVESGRPRLPVTEKITGSNPVSTAILMP